MSLACEIRTDMMRSMTAIGTRLCYFKSWERMAKPTPCMRNSSIPLPFQKMVYPELSTRQQRVLIQSFLLVGYCSAKSTNKGKGKGLVACQGVSTHRWAITHYLRAPPYCSEIPWGLAWRRWAPSIRVRPRRGTSGVLTTERLCTGSEDLCTLLPFRTS